MRSSIEYLSICGVRAFSPERVEKLKFEKPLTIILGQNGCGKTTVIECLKAACTGAMPPGTNRGRNWIHDPGIFGEREVKARVKLQFSAISGRKMMVERRYQLTQKTKKREFKQLEAAIVTRDNDGKIQQVSHRCSELDKIVPELLGTTTAILDNVVFCHQEDTAWPLSESTKLKEKFDAIFSSTRYSKALKEIKETQKQYNRNLKIYKKDLEIFQAHCDEFERLAKEKKDQDTEIIKLNRKMEESETRASQMEEKIEKAESVIEEIQEKQREISVLDGKNEELKKSVKSLKSTVKDVIEWDDQTLNTRISEYDEVLSNLNKKRKNEGRKLKSAEEFLSRTQDTRNKISAKLGVLRNNQKNYRKTCEMLAVRINELVKKYSTEKKSDEMVDEDEEEDGGGPDDMSAIFDSFNVKDEYSGEEVKEFTEMLQNQLNKWRKQLKRMKRDHQKIQEDENAKISQVKGEVQARQAQVKESRKKMKIGKREIRKLKDEIDDVKETVEDLSESKSELDRRTRELEKRKEGSDMDELGEKIKELEDNGKKLNEKMKDVMKKMKLREEEKKYTHKIASLKDEKSDQEKQFEEKKNESYDTLKKCFGKIGDRMEDEDDEEEEEDDDDDTPKKKDIQANSKSIKSLLRKLEKTKKKWEKKRSEEERNSESIKEEVSEINGSLQYHQKQHKTYEKRKRALESKMDMLKKVNFQQYFLKKKKKKKKKKGRDMEDEEEEEEDSDSDDDSDTESDNDNTTLEELGIFEDSEKFSVSKFNVDGVIRKLTRAEKKHRASLTGGETMLDSIDMYVSHAEDRNKCYVCRRNFASPEDQKQFIKRQRNLRKRFPKLKKELSNSIDKVAKVLEMLRVLQPEIKEYKDLVEESIPTNRSKMEKMEKEVEKSKKELKGVKKKLGGYTTKLEKIGDGLGLGKDLMRIVERLESVEQKIKEVRNEMTRGSSGRSMRDEDDEEDLDEEETYEILQEKYTEYQNKVMKGNSRIQRLRSELDEKQQDLERLREAVARVQKKCHKYELKVQELKNLETKLKEEEKSNRSLEEKVEDWETQAIPALKKKLSSLKEDLQENFLRKHRKKESRLDGRIQTFLESSTSLQSESRQIIEYLQNDGDSELDKTENEYNKSNIQIEESQTKLEDIREKVEKLDKKIRNSASVEQNLRDNFQLRQKEKELTKSEDKRQLVINELKQLTSSKKTSSRLTDEDEDEEEEDEDEGELLDERGLKKMKKELSKVLQQQSKYEGSLRTLRDRVKTVQKELRRTRFNDVFKRHKSTSIKLETTKRAANDLEKYHAALEASLMKYHKVKIREINDIIRELWQETYRGQDIDTIAIHSDRKTGKRGGYDYRVQMVKGNTKLDMRGRCSAGQKILACFIIRLALAESFCLNFGVLTLDEPTTNLDVENIGSLADSLKKIVEERRKQANFQLLVITHDEDFVQRLGRSEFVEHYYRVSKDPESMCSTLTKKSFNERN